MGKPFEIPVSSLKQLNEFSSGGFLLLTFDEFGNPRLMAKFDSAVHSMAAQKYISQWIEATNDAQINQISKAITGDEDED